MDCLSDASIALLLGEIEQHVRKLIEGKFALSELQEAKDPADAQRTVERVADLTLGEYIRLLEVPEPLDEAQG
jgi:hypothetical protein